MAILDEMNEVFREKFGATETHAYFSPGRVNLIGEHTDYNGGHVFPCAISLGIWALAAPRQGTDRVRLHSMNFEADGTTEAPARGLEYREERGWANYPLGVLRVLEEAGGNRTAAAGRLGISRTTLWRMIRAR